MLVLVPVWVTVQACDSVGLWLDHHYRSVHLCIAVSCHWSLVLDSVRRVCHCDDMTTTQRNTTNCYHVETTTGTVYGVACDTGAEARVLAHARFVSDGEDMAIRSVQRIERCNWSYGTVLAY